jgi:glycosyltransferase involved in cell wall biosynthesis
MQIDDSPIGCSIVVPIYGDGYLARAFCAEVMNVMVPYSGPEGFEVIFVNDGSRDDSLQELLKLGAQYPFVTVVDLSRNFGQHAAIACGMHKARGQVVLRMNVDMQDPPAEIPRMVDTLREGDFDLVVGRYAERRSPWLNKVTALLFFYIFKFLTGFESPQNTSPLRAMSRRFVAAYNGLTEKSRFPQGLDQWLGFRHKYIEIEHRDRVDGRSSYNFWSRLKLALNGVLYFSDRPLTLVALAGFCLAAFGFVLSAYVIAEKLLGVEYLPGYASLVALALTGFGVQLGCTGLVGLYVAKIFREVQNRPLYIVRETY